MLFLVLLQVMDSVAAVLPDVVGENAWVKLLMPILVIVSGYLATKGMGYIKAAADWIHDALPVKLAFLKIDGFPAAIQRIILLGIAGALVWLGSFLGIELPTDIALIGETDLSGGILALGTMAFALLFHAPKKK